MRILALCAALVLTMTSAAQAEERMRVHEIHNYLSALNSAINHSDMGFARQSMGHLISSQAVFEDNVNANNPSYYQWAGNPYVHNMYGYRYPYFAGYHNVGYRTMNKWEKISHLEAKKRTVPGYRGMFELVDFTVAPMRETAVLDVEFKEQSLSYAPGAPYHYHYTNLNTHSKCKMHLAKMNEQVFMTRMYCNTNTNLPM
jgi:hypothetical protein